MPQRGFGTIRHKLNKLVNKFSTDFVCFQKITMWSTSNPTNTNRIFKFVTIWAVFLCVCEAAQELRSAHTEYWSTVRTELYSCRCSKFILNFLLWMLLSLSIYQGFKSAFVGKKNFRHGCKGSLCAPKILISVKETYTSHYSAD